MALCDYSASDDLLELLSSYSHEISFLKADALFVNVVCYKSKVAAQS